MSDEEVIRQVEALADEMRALADKTDALMVRFLRAREARQMTNPHGLTTGAGAK